MQRGQNPLADGGGKADSYCPFVVADRPNHFEIIQRALRGTDEVLGVMTHANVSESVVDLIANWPEDLRDQTVLMADSGAFQAAGAPSYPDLFETYSQMDVDYGVIIDEVHDADKTVKSAREAADLYETLRPDWTLVGVTQGRDMVEYRDCYQRLRDIGYECLAVGGLLQLEGKRSGGHATTNSQLMWSVLQTLVKENPDEWLFALGCGHPSRHPRFADLGLVGADGKGWLHRYGSPHRRHEDLIAHLQHEVLNYDRQMSLREASEIASA